MLRVLLAALALLPFQAQAQVIFSRRVYAQHGRSYQQLWMWNAADGSIKPLTDSPRDHTTPVCSRDGKRVLFVSGAQGVWSFDLATHKERPLWTTTNADSIELVGVARGGAPLIEKEWVRDTRILSGLFAAGARATRFPGMNMLSVLSPDGARLVRYKDNGGFTDKPEPAYVTDAATGRSQVQIGRCGDVVWSPDSKRIACSNGYVIAANGSARRPIAQCPSIAWSPDGKRLACVSGESAAILDTSTWSETERVKLPTAPNQPPADELRWSPDETKLLVGVNGQETNSGSPQSDFLMLDLTSEKWTHAGSGNNAVWLPGRNEIVYSTPRDLKALPGSSKHNVWTAHLALFDFATHKQTMLTSGVTNNEYPVVCGR
ncbi:MAG TPA: hypothetical protein VHW24_13525 [Bryobacteraceae bacterium]|nr:hypothetical protein [Bryobacteraceae bacterium]